MFALSDAATVALITGLPAMMSALAAVIVVVRQSTQGKMIASNSVAIAAQDKVTTEVIVPRLIAVDTAVNGAKAGDNTLVASVNNIAKDMTEVHEAVVGTGSADSGTGTKTPADADPRAATPKKPDVARRKKEAT